ncbi:MAG: response regulator [Myxococcales bacterium]|nr:response regulator [Myxococcales bacterium]
MGIKVLVVDDSTMLRRQIARALLDSGFEVVEAANGVEAIEKLSIHAETRLIVCDVDMPRMNGLELLERLSASGPRVPVIMLTTEGKPQLVQRAKALGAKGWIVKPFKPDLLVAAIKKVTGAA